MSTPSDPLTILGLRVENVKAVKVISLRPKANGIVKIKGKNAQGKTSTLDAIELALSGKISQPGGRAAQPEDPIREGADSAVVLADLGGKFTVKRTWSEKGSRLTVTRKDNGITSAVARPQEFLDSLDGAGIAFDPLAFSRRKPAEQVQAVLDILKLPTDPRTLDAERKVLYDERTLVNRSLKTAEGAALQAGDIRTDLPGIEVSVADLVKEHGRRVAQQGENAKVVQALKEATEIRNLIQGEIADLERQLSEQQERLADQESDIQVIQAQTDALVDPDIASIAQQIATAETTNGFIRENRRRQSLQEELDAIRLKSEMLTTQIEDIDADKVTLLSQAQFPVPDLAIQTNEDGSYVLTYRGVPLADCSSSEKLRLSIAMAMALSPTVRVILIREASMLDEESQKAIEVAALEHGYQVWLELVDTTPEEGAFVIEAGEIK